jgi:DNA-binding NarL/FixJ family response regulator
MKKIRIIMVDNEKLFVQSLRIVLETRAEDMEVVGLAYNGAEAVELVKQCRPDVVLMDVLMPVMDGVESTRLIKEQYPDMKVLMLTTFDGDQDVVEALRLGAVGYLLKDMPPEELISAVRAVHEGGVLISHKVATKLVEKIASPAAKGKDPAGPAISSNSWVDELSDREKKILQLMAQGLDNKEIAKTLYIAEQTVKNHVSIIYSKLGVRDRVQASRLVIEAGLDKEDKDGEDK